MKLSESVELLNFLALFRIIDWAVTDKCTLFYIALLPACSATLVWKVRLKDPTYSDAQRAQRSL